MDRWQIEVSGMDETNPPEEHSDQIPYNIINNYFSVGVVSTFLFYIDKFRK